MSNEEIFRLIRSGPKGRECVARYLCSHDQLKNGTKKVMSKIQSPLEDDFWEIFDMTIMKFFKRVLTDKEFVIDKNLHSYLFVIARHLWIQELDRRNKLPEELPEDYELTSDSTATIQAMMENEELRRLLEKLLDLMGEPCKTILMMWMQGEKMRAIQKRIGLNSEGAARKKKFDCLKKLLDFLDNNPDFKDMLR